jgi:hypothetical protein
VEFARGAATLPPARAPPLIRYDATTTRFAHRISTIAPKPG